MRKWTKETAERYIKQAKEKGLTYWSAVDYLKYHKMMHSIVQNSVVAEQTIYDLFVSW